MDKRTIATAEPFFLQGGKTACLLIHGFTGSPKEMRPLGDALHQHGLTVLSIRLAGHATQPGDMIRTRYRDWIASVEDGINLLKDSYEHVFYAGLSMGGVLALTAASYLPPSGVLALSTPFELDPDWRINIARPLSYIIPWVKKNHSNNNKTENFHVDYPAYPTRSIAELKDLTKVMQRSLGQVKTPVLMINSKADPTVPYAHTKKFEKLLAPERYEQVTLQTSGHVITEDTERQVVFDAATRFIDRISRT
jgi:carboxylesterase